MISRPAVVRAARRSSRPARTLVAVLVVLATLLPGTSASADQRSTLAPDELRSIASQAAGWLSSTALDPDGAIRTPTGELDGPTTAFAVLALKAAGLDAEAENPTRWLEQNIDAVAKNGDRESAAGLAILILVARAQNLPGEVFGNEDLVQRLLATRGPDGLFGGEEEMTDDPLGGVPSRQGLVLAALGASGRTDAGAAEWLEERQCPDGGWEFRRVDPDAPCSATSQTTGYALQGLAAVGRSVPPEAITALKGLQEDDGGFSSFPGNSDASATAIALQGLLAAGEDPNSDRWRKGSGAGGTTPFGALARSSTVEGGFSLFPGGTPDPVVTARVTVAAAGQPLPLNPPLPSEETEPDQDTTTAAGSAGDSFSVVPLIGLMVVAAAVIGAVYAYRRRQQAV